jgi:hypothetical protein
MIELGLFRDFVNSTIRNTDTIHETLREMKMQGFLRFSENSIKDLLKFAIFDIDPEQI